MNTKPYTRKGYRRTTTPSGGGAVSSSAANKPKEFVPTAAGAYNAGLTILGYKSYSEREVYDKLLNKGYPAEMAASAIAKLIEYGFCNDEKYGESLLRGWLAKGGRGKQHLRQLLVNHKLGQELIQNLLEELDHDMEADLMNEAMESFVLRNRRKIAAAQDYESQRKIVAAAARFLMSRGFSGVNGSTIADYLKNKFKAKE